MVRASRVLTLNRREIYHSYHYLIFLLHGGLPFGSIKLQKLRGFVEKSSGAYLVYIEVPQ